MASEAKGRRRSLRLAGFDYTQSSAYFVTICVQDRACLFGRVESEFMTLSSVGGMVSDFWSSLPDRFPGLVLDEWIVMPNHMHGILILPGRLTVGAPLAGAHVPTSERGQPQGLPLPNQDHRVGAPLAGAHVLTPEQGQPQGLPLPNQDHRVGAPLAGARAPMLKQGQPQGLPLPDQDHRVGASLVGIHVPAPGQGQPQGLPLPDERVSKNSPTLGSVIGAFKSLTAVTYARGVKAHGWPRLKTRLWQRNYYEHIVRSERALETTRQYIAWNPARWKDDDMFVATP